MKKFLLIVSVASLLLLMGCSDKTTVPDYKSLSYDQYRALYVTCADDLKFDGFTKVSDDTDVFGGTIVLVEKAVTFGTREELTESGLKNDPKPQSTQNRIVYQNKSEGYVLYINFIYLRHDLDKDLVSYDIGAPQELQDLATLKEFKQTQLSYKNTLVQLELISTTGKPSSSEKMMHVTQSVVDFLQKTGSK